MAHRSPQQHRRHAGDARGAADVEQQEPASTQPDLRPEEQRDVPDTQKHAQFGGAETPEGEVEGADGVSGQIDLDGKHEVGDEQAERDVRAHITAEPETSNQEKRSDGVGDVIDIKSVTRAEAVTDAGQGTIQAVAEPVDGKRQNHRDERAAVPTGGPIAETRYQHGGETEKREMV